MPLALLAVTQRLQLHRTLRCCCCCVSCVQRVGLVHVRHQDRREYISSQVDLMAVIRRVVTAMAPSAAKWEKCSSTIPVIVETVSAPVRWLQLPAEHGV